MAEEFSLKWLEYVERLVYFYSYPHFPLVFIYTSLRTVLCIKLYIANHKINICCHAHTLSQVVLEYRPLPIIIFSPFPQYEKRKWNRQKKKKPTALSQMLTFNYKTFAVGDLSFYLS